MDDKGSEIKRRRGGEIKRIGEINKEVRWRDKEEREGVEIWTGHSGKQCVFSG